MNSETGVIFNMDWYLATTSSYPEYKPIICDKRAITGLELCAMRDNKRNWSELVYTTIKLMANEKHHIRVVEPDVSETLFYAKKNVLSASVATRKSFQLFDNTVTLLLMPIIHKGHIYLVAIKLDEKEITVVDSLLTGKYEIDANRVHLERFKLILTMYKMESDGWNFRVMQHLVQKHIDVVNCGPFTIKHSQQLINRGATYTQEFDPSVYREKLVKALLSSSESMLEKCLVCCGPRHAVIVECPSCQKFVHVQCFLPDMKPKVRFKICDMCNQLSKSQHSLIQN